jgi:hypothetical protein
MRRVLVVAITGCLAAVSAGCGMGSPGKRYPGRLVPEAHDPGQSPSVPGAAAVVVAQVIRLPAPKGSRKLIPAVNLSRAQSPWPAGCKQFCRSQTDTNELEIAQSAGKLQVSGPRKGGWTPIRVRGHPGRAVLNLSPGGRTA